MHAAPRNGWPAPPAVAAEDGSFRIGGLLPGRYDVFVTSPGTQLRRPGMRGPRLAEDVDAGSEGLVLRIPGSMIRGRLLDASGAPAGGRGIVAWMRDAPSEQGTLTGTALATTDAEGRFWLLRLLPGVYDLEVRGHLPLRGATGVEAGREERTVEMLASGEITGRVVDERGVPMAGVSVGVTLPETPWNSLQATSTTTDGAFRLTHLDPSLRYRVAASFDGGESRVAVAEKVATGTEGLVFRIDTTPRLRFRVDFSDRGDARSAWLRVERVSGGPLVMHKFTGSPVNWLAAPPGTWKVLARVRDVDAQGIASYPWIEIGTVTTGEPEKTLVVPR